MPAAGAAALTATGGAVAAAAPEEDEADEDEEVVEEREDGDGDDKVGGAEEEDASATVGDGVDDVSEVDGAEEAVPDSVDVVVVSVAASEAGDAALGSMTYVLIVCTMWLSLTIVMEVGVDVGCVCGIVERLRYIMSGRSAQPPAARKFPDGSHMGIAGGGGGYQRFLTSTAKSTAPRMKKLAPLA